MAATDAPKYTELLPYSVSLWTCFGFAVHVVHVVESGALPRQQAHSELAEYLRNGAAAGLLTFETFAADFYSRNSLPGLSRLVAASAPIFNSSFVVLADVDLLPARKAPKYMRELQESAFASGKASVYFDFEYPERTAARCVQRNASAAINPRGWKTFGDFRNNLY